MATIDVTWTPNFDFRVCAGQCNPVTLTLGFTSVPKQVLYNAWPKDDLGNPVPVPWTLTGQASSGASIVPQSGFVTPDTATIRLDGLTLADDAYTWTMTLAYTDGDDVTTTATQTKIVLIDCGIRCCSARLAQLVQGRCSADAKQDAAQVLVLRRAMKSLLACDNNVSGAVEMLHKIQAICRKHNCNCN